MKFAFSLLLLSLAIFPAVAQAECFTTYFECKCGSMKDREGKKVRKDLKDKATAISANICSPQDDRNSQDIRESGKLALEALSMKCSNISDSGRSAYDYTCKIEEGISMR